MKISHVQPPAPYRVRPMQLAFIATATVVAISLLSFYVQLLNRSVERGEHLRYGQQASVTTPSAARRHGARGELSAAASSETAVRE